MKLLHSLLQRQIVQQYSSRVKQINLDFTVEALKCHKDDQHKVKGLDTEVDVPPFACSFNKFLLRGHMLAVADEDGSVCLFDLRKQGSSSKLKGWVAHSNAIFDIAWIHDEPKLVTASGDQTAQLWDIQHSKKLAVFRGHSCSLKSVDFQDGNLFVFATGARDGNVMIWDVRCNKRDGYYQPVNTIHNCHSTTPGTLQRSNKKRRRRFSAIVGQDSQQSVTSVKFQDENIIISAGAVDGNIKVWDLRKNYSNIRMEPVPCHVFPYPGSGTRKHGFSSLALDSNKSKLFANCTNDLIYMYDCISFKKGPLGFLHGHSNTTFYVKAAVSPDDQFLMSGSGDCDAYIWNIGQPKAAPFHLTGHVGEVTSVAWCPKDQGKVVTCSDDNYLNIWRVKFGDKDNDMVGWCERKPCSNLPSETTDNLHGKVKTPNTSPTRSLSSSTSSSPVSLSPNTAKCSSPQQFLQSWLKSSCKINNDNKRTRENDYSENLNKRYCLEDRIQAQRNVVHNSDLNKNVTMDPCLLTSVFNSKKTSDQDIKETCSKPLKTILSETNMDNIEIHWNTAAKCKTTNYNKQLHPHSGKENLSMNRTDSGNMFALMSVVRSEQPNCKNKNQKQDKNLNKVHKTLSMNCDQMIDEKKLIRGSTSGRGSEKDKTLCQPTSPQVPEPCLPDKVDKKSEFSISRQSTRAAKSYSSLTEKTSEFDAVLRSTRGIRAYFKPIPECDKEQTGT